MLLAALDAASEYCLLYVYKHGLLPLAIRIQGPLVAAGCLLWYLRSFLTKGEILWVVTKTSDMFTNRGICHKSSEQVLTNATEKLTPDSTHQTRAF